jgi:hypothetical protein
MRTFRNPWWLIVISIIPVAILFWIFLGAFQMIEGLLSSDNISAWIIFGSMLGTLWSVHLSYTVMLIRKKMSKNKY